MVSEILLSDPIKTIDKTTSPATTQEPLQSTTYHPPSMTHPGRSKQEKPLKPLKSDEKRQIKVKNIEPEITFANL